MITRGSRTSPSEMTFWDHLTELRSRIIKCAIAIAVGTVFGILLYDWMIADIFLPPYCHVLENRGIDQPCALVITEPLDGFRTKLRVGIYAGFVFAMPVLLWQVWRFITPALHKNEKKWAIPFVVSALLLFVTGAGLAYYTFERALDFLISFGGDSVDPLFTPGSYLGLITYMMMAFGVGFQFPIVLLFLQLAGIVEPRTLGKGRRYAVVGIVTLAAVITPSGDPISLAALSVPMYIFYELSIVVGHVLTRRRRGWVPRKERRAADAES